MKMYSPNNIKFRIVSSSVIAQFKQDQAFDFNELVNNHDVNSFSKESREILLLNYELWFKFICRFEKMIIRTLHSNDSIDCIVDCLECLISDLLTNAKEIINTNPAIFSTNEYPAQITEFAFKPFVDNILATIKECRNDTMYIAFPKVVTSISTALSNLLCILQEIEVLRTLPTHDDFLSYTYGAIDVKERMNICPLLERANLYRSKFGVTTFAIKNYTKDQIPQGLIDDFCLEGFVIQGKISSDR